MRIGLTYDLREPYLESGLSEEETAEFDRPETIDAIAEALGALGHEPLRIGGIHDLTRALGRDESFDLVFNLAEGLRGTARESQVPALLDAFGIPYTFSGPLTLALALHKAVTKTIVRDQGVATAPFVLIREQEAPPTIPLDYPLFVKPEAEGSGMGIYGQSKVTDRNALDRAVRALRVWRAGPILVESFLPGREFTVGILGSGQDAQPLGVLEIQARSSEDQAAYGYLAKEEYDQRIDYRLVEDDAATQAAALALKTHRILGCQDASRVDIRLDPTGEPCFLEINPLAGLHPVRSDLVILARARGWSYTDLIRAIIHSALERTRGHPLPLERRPTHA
ncbi:MAG: D-alanine--D-alanine ligase family protein [Gammaproteobacteria bacterium]